MKKDRLTQKLNMDNCNMASNFNKPSIKCQFQEQLWKVSDLKFEGMGQRVYVQGEGLPASFFNTKADFETKRDF